jgi:proteasome assembly chaperone (PAC2) family protein
VFYSFAKNRVLQSAYSMAGSGREVMTDPKGAKAVLDGAAVNSMNVIAVEMKDLMEKDRNKCEPEMQCDIEDVMAKKRDTRFHAS